MPVATLTCVIQLNRLHIIEPVQRALVDIVTRILMVNIVAIANPRQPLAVHYSNIRHMAIYLHCFNQLNPLVDTSEVPFWGVFFLYNHNRTPVQL